MSFILDPTLERDSQHILKMSLCDVRLIQDARYVWLILVPERAGLMDWHDLSDQDAQQAAQEMQTASRVLSTLYNPEKTNVATLGNMVKQLHIHVIARFKDDPAWPAPIWGIGEAIPYKPEPLNQRVTELTTGFSKDLGLRT